MLSRSEVLGEIVNLCSHSWARVPIQYQNLVSLLLSLFFFFFFCPTVSENGDHQSHMTRAEHHCGRGISPVQNPRKELGWAPVLQSKSLLDLEVCEMLGALVHGPVSRWIVRIPHYSVICCCLLTAQNCMNSVETAFHAITSHLFGLGSAIFLWTPASFHCACTQWLHISQYGICLCIFLNLPNAKW
jgi:hypothetical protein